MKCRTCGNEMEIRQTESGKVAICHNCKIKRRLVKKSEVKKKEPDSGQAYSNIPEEEVRSKSEREVKQNYQQMLEAGDDAPAPRKRKAAKSQPPARKKKKKKNIIGRVILIVLLIAILGVGGYFGYRYYKDHIAKPKNQTEQDKNANNETGQPAQSDSIDVTNDDFAVKFVKTETAIDENGYTCLLVYYDYTNNRKDMNSSALADVHLTATQNDTPCSDAVLKDTLEEINNAAKELAAGETLTVCQAFTLADSSDVKLTISETLDADNASTGTKTVTIQ